MFVARLEGAGLKVALSSDPTALYVRVGASLGRMEEEAERIKFMKQLDHDCICATRDKVRGQESGKGLVSLAVVHIVSTPCVDAAPISPPRCSPPRCMHFHHDVPALTLSLQELVMPVMDWLNDDDPSRPVSKAQSMNVYAPFNREKRLRFRHSLLSPNELWSSAERQQLVCSIIEADLSYFGAQIEIDSGVEKWG